MLMTYLLLGALGALAGYAVYRATVEVLNRTNIKDVIRSAIEKASAQKRMKAVVREILDSGDKKTVKVDILNDLDESKACEVEITSSRVEQIYKGSVICNFA